MKDESQPVGVINLGSISNISVLKAGKCEIGFDMGPANLWIDYLAKKIPDNTSGIDFDGSLSSKGKVIPTVLEQWMKNKYIKRQPPKSAGYEDFSTAAVDTHIDKHNQTDLLRTAVEFSAQCIQKSIEELAKKTPLQKIYLCGGGVYNPTLVSAIKSQLKGIEVLL